VEDLAKQFEVIIIGGGPAGSACAYDLAKSGRSVLIIEKNPFPRFKPCAGMLTIKALHRLPYSIAPVVKWSSDSMTISREFKAEKTLQASKAVVVTTIRSELDEFCLNKALEAGAKLKICDKGFQSYKMDGDRIHVTVSTKDQGAEILSCDYLVGADGAHSKVRKQSEQFTPDRTAVALEGRVPLSRITTNKYKNGNKELRFDFNVAKKGYGWLIPKDDHINVGVYTRRPDEYPLSKTQLQNYTERLLGTREIDELLGFPVGTGGEYFTPPKGNVLLVGDAGGYAEPIFGEGIHNAIKSGRAAAVSIQANIDKSLDAGEEYREAVEAVTTDVWWCRQIAKPFYKFIVPALMVLSRRPIRTVVMEGFSDGLTIKECLKVLSPLHTVRPYAASETAKALKASGFKGF
jgi:geranylgeranyl reductase family protein